MSVWWFLTSMSNKEDADKYKKALEEKDKEIERLNNLLKETSQTLSEQITKAITLKSENERLNNELKSLQDSYDIEEEQANYHIDLTDDLREEVDRLNNIIKHIEDICESSIASVNKILQDEKETIILNGRCINRNEYQIVRLKAYRTKSKEILGRIKELKGGNGAIPPQVIGTNGEDGGLFDYGDR